MLLFVYLTVSGGGGESERALAKRSYLCACVSVASQADVVGALASALKTMYNNNKHTQIHCSGSVCSARKAVAAAAAAECK